MALEQPASYLAGSAAAVLQAVSQPPHLDDQAVNEMETAIAQGRLVTRDSDFQRVAGLSVEDWTL